MENRSRELAVGRLWPLFQRTGSALSVFIKILFFAKLAASLLVGTISQATVLSRNTTHTCRRWDDKSDPVIRYDPGERQNYCSFPDYQYGMECTTEQQPWCYIEGGDELNKYGVCDIPKCQCGSTGLTFTDVLDRESKVPDDLSFLKGDTHAEHFADIIDNWNSNTPDDSSNIFYFYSKTNPFLVESADVCSYWKKRNEKTRERRAVDFYNYGDYEDEQDSSDSDDSGIIDETEEVETTKSADVLMRIINGLVLMHNYGQIMLKIVPSMFLE